MATVALTICKSLYTIKDYEGHILGYAYPNDLFIEVEDLNTDEFNDALVELDSHWNRRCWLMCKHEDDDAIELAQRTTLGQALV